MSKRAKAKDDPYYLFDEKEESEDVEDIPIVRLDDAELGDGGKFFATAAYVSLILVAVVEAPIKKSKSGKSIARPAPEAAPPEFDRSGEMPDGAPGPSISQSTLQPESARAGLAGVDLLGDPPPTSRTNSSARYEEYKVDEADEKVDLAPVGGEVEVVRVRRKKKGGKEGRKKVEGT